MKKINQPHFEKPAFYFRPDHGRLICIWPDDFKQRFIGATGHELTITAKMVFSDDWGLSVRADAEMTKTLKELNELLEPGETIVSDGEDVGSLQ